MPEHPDGGEMWELYGCETRIRLLWILTFAIWAWTPVVFRAATAFWAAAGLSKSTKPYPEETSSTVKTIFYSQCRQHHCGLTHALVWSVAILCVHLWVWCVAITKLYTVCLFTEYTSAFFSLIFLSCSHMCDSVCESRERKELRMQIPVWCWWSALCPGVYNQSEPIVSDLYCSC